MIDVFTECINEFRCLYPIKSIKGIMYCDESNNVRVPKLVEGGTNQDLQDLFFTLGGIIILDGNNVNLNEIFNDVPTDQIPRDAKLRYFSKNKSEFKEILRSDRLKKYFEFLLDKGIYIHISIHDWIYYSIIDLFDSIFDYGELIGIDHIHAKGEFYDVLMSDYDGILELLYKYEYPNIKQADVKNFMYELYDFYETQAYGCFDMYNFENFCKEYLRQLLKSKRDKNELIFIQENKPYVLEESVIEQYLLKISIFPDMVKRFDNEDKIRHEIISINKNYENDYNMKFCESSEILGIQLSDVICGFIAKMVNFVTQTTIEEISEFLFKNKDSIVLENLILFKRLFDKSLELYELNYFSNCSERTQIKLAQFYDLIEILKEC